MKVRIFITGMGIISPVGSGHPQTRHFITNGGSGIKPVSLFRTRPDSLLPVGEIVGLPEPKNGLPRTHVLAMTACTEALHGRHPDVDAVVMGVSTGGMLTSEHQLKHRDRHPEHYRFHSPGSVAEYLAQQVACTGPVITIANACSSGSAGIKVAVEMIRTGLAARVLVGGADSLCRFTYFGFNALQLIDPEGARPFDKHRKGMTVSEGAAVLLVEGSDHIPDNAMAEIRGAGLSCDAFHPAAPHPEGDGAREAMTAALRDAAVTPGDIDYINLHGTGTIDNDRAEARAVYAVFGDHTPLLSSIKGSTGHSLAAAGAIEAAVSAICISEGTVPENYGFTHPDPELNLHPATRPTAATVQTVLSNSFGFGGNNASVVIGACGTGHPKTVATLTALGIAGSACLSGAGETDPTMSRFSAGESCRGVIPMNDLSRRLPPKLVRRLKRLPRMALALAEAAAADASEAAPIELSSVFLGTGWGACSETYDFLEKLFASDEKFSSPTDFVGSVHNAAAGQIAIRHQARGANVTTTGGDYSFEQALLTACLLASRSPADLPALVVGADEYHDPLSGLFDPSVAADNIPSDGGGALCLTPVEGAGGLTIFPAFFERADTDARVTASLVDRLGGPDRINRAFGCIFAGIPAACRTVGARQLNDLISASGFKGPVVDFRALIGHFAASTAVAAVMAARFVETGVMPSVLSGMPAVDLQHKGILILNTGPFVTATEIGRP